MVAACVRARPARTPGGRKGSGSTKNVNASSKSLGASARTLAPRGKFWPTAGNNTKTKVKVDPAFEQALKDTLADDSKTGGVTEGGGEGGALSEERLKAFKAVEKPLPELVV